MANYENIKDANSKRTPSERREIARIAGKASGKARRRKANMRETANRLLTMVGEVEGLSDILRADGGESTYEEIITMAMIQKAAMGDVKAYEALKSTVGQTDKSDADLEEQRIRTDRAKRARDQEVGDTDAGDENIQSFLKALNPSEEELQNLFAEENEEGENGEEKEETGGI
ncbi:putative uncharacterized protein [Firmicutes bacterium CAG:646]|nr:putative uncharacterized protein [Firmicutes bacterium CAG:646]